MQPNNSYLSPLEAGICLLAIERQHTVNDVLMLGDPWYSGDPSNLKRLEDKLIHITREER